LNGRENPAILREVYLAKVRKGYRGSFVIFKFLRWKFLLCLSLFISQCIGSKAKLCTLVGECASEVEIPSSEDLVCFAGGQTTGFFSRLALIVSNC